ncbi:MAG: SdpI family protein [Oscillospiraceae bacterium]|nr:SdpI family protein [Oscillospiraceae bacterium]
MKSKVNAQAVLSTLVCLMPIALGLVLYGRLPDQLPTHFDISGNPDSYSSKAIVCFAFPVGFALINLFTHFMLNADPKKRNANAVIRSVGMWAVPVMSLIIIPVTLFKGLGYNLPIAMITLALVGMLLLITGNYMPKCRQNYTVGIRLPWTLDSEENWTKTHRFSGFVWVLGGFAVIVDTFIGSFYVMLGIIALLVILPVIYSYLFYRRQKAKKENEQ